jgi:ERCC4-type nuclease
LSLFSSLSLSILLPGDLIMPELKEVFIDTREKKSVGPFDTNFDAFLSYLNPHPRKAKQLTYKAQLLPVGDFWIHSDLRLDILELKIDFDCINSLNKIHLQSQLDKMEKFATTKPKGLACGIALTDDFMAKYNSKDMFHFTKRLYALKKEFPAVKFFMTSDSVETKLGIPKITSAVVVCLEKWFGWVGRELAAERSPTEPTVFRPPIMERDFHKGPLYAIVAGCQGWTEKKAFDLFCVYSSLYDVIQLTQPEIERVLADAGHPHAVADSINLYELFHTPAIKNEQFLLKPTPVTSYENRFNSSQFSASD